MVTDYFCGQLHQSVNILFPLESTEEVISLAAEEICPIPGVDSALLGVVNQRGKLLWVLELSELLQIDPAQNHKKLPDNLTLLVLGGNSGQQIGCVVSALKGIITLDLAKQSLNSSFSQMGNLVGMKSITFNDEDYALIDVQAILTNIYEPTYTN
jgi:twitching motility protein PilI